MKILKKSLSILLVLTMLLSCFGSASAANVMTKEQWDKYWSDTDEISAAVTMFPGDNETERYVAWYSDNAEGYVELTSAKGTEKIDAQAKQTAQGDYRLGAVLKELEEGEYTYKCVSGDFTSDSYTFSVEAGNDFTALFVTDIHVSQDKNDSPVDTSGETAFRYNQTLEAAYNKALSQGNTLDLIVSAGDQASGGYRKEFVGLSSPSYMKSIPFAISVGNHDRKSVDYKYYTFLPNETDNTFRSYIGTDYYFTQGNALFLVYDSNNSSMHGHYDFTKEAVEANPDAKWIIAVMHHDLYGGREPELDTENALLKLLWTPIFDKFGIDLCLYGHSHFHTISNVIHNNKTVESLVGKDSVTDPKGTIYMATGSINNTADPTREDGSEHPLGENAAHSYLAEDAMYSLLQFSDDSLAIKCYTVDGDEEFDSLTITKTTQKGGHKYNSSKFFLLPLIFFVSRIVNVINNIDMYERYVDQGYDVSLGEGLVGTKLFG